MKAPKTRLTVSSLLIGSLLLCAAPKHASSQQTADGAKQVEQMVQTCFTAPAQQAVQACERVAALLSQRPDKLAVVGGGINARLSDVLGELGRYAEAEAPARKAVAAAQASKQRGAIAAQQDRLASVLKHLGRYSESEDLFRSATELAKKEYGPDDLQAAATMGNLAGVLKDQGKLGESESLFRKSLAIFEKKLDPDHPHLATTLNNLAMVLMDQGKLGESESLFRKSLAIREKKLDPDHPHLATTLRNLAGVLQDQGKLVEAESLFRKSLAIVEKKLDPDHPELATTLGNLAMVLKDQGKLVEAESLLRKTLAIDQKKLDPDHPELATTLNNLALVLYAQGKLGEAESLFRKSLAIYEKKLDPDHPELATTLGNLAGVLYDQGKLVEAESLLRKSLAIEQKRLDLDHPSLATTLHNLALVLMDQGKPGEAESLLRKSLAIREKKLDPDHPHLAATHSNLSVLRLAQGNVKGAVTEQQQHIQSFDKLLRTSSTEDQAEALLASESADENAVYGLPLLSGASQDADRLAMSTALLFKGRTLEAGRMVRRELQQGLKTEEQKKKYQGMVELLGKRDQELTRMTQGSGDRAKAQELLWKAQKLERELSKEIGVRSSADVPTLDDVTQKVARALPKDAVLIELGLGMTADYRRSAYWQTTMTFHYVAMLLFPSGEVRVVKLGEKDKIEEATKRFLAALDKPSRDIEKAAKSAYTTLFASLEKELGGVHQVIVSPDGAMSAIPFGALHNDKGYLVDQLSFRYVSSGRDLLNQPIQKPTMQPAVMMATRVPGQDTLVVAEKVGQDIAKTQQAKLTERATDGQVLSQQSPSVLTLISHGYFGGDSKEGGMNARLPPLRKHMPSQYMGLMGFERDIAPQAKLVMAEKEKTEELMNDSGLMMMPGSQASTDTKQDGRLTAVEVREMNLQGTKLVMLLACKGAAGGLSFGQGVYGLRRAVLQAGAETVVGTLWSVEEKSASELAKNYMTKLWTDKKATRVGAMEAAMKEMRKDPRYSHPHYWAPFVVMGMDGPLGN